MTDLNYTLLAFAIYFVGLISIGVLSYRRSVTATDYLVGGRSLNFYVTALSAHASDMSSWLFMAYPVIIFTSGGVELWAAVGLLAGMWANWQFVAPRLRRETEATGTVTLSGYFNAKYSDHAATLRSLGAVIALFFFTIYVSAGLVGMGYLFETILGFDRIAGMSVCIFVVVVYTCVGGFYSIAWIDLCQGVFLLLMIVLVPLVAMNKIGGWETVAQALTAKGLSLSPIPRAGWSSLVIILFNTLGWGLGYFGQIHILSKFMGIKKPEELKKAKWVGMSWQTICLIASTMIGLVGVAFFYRGIDNPELVFILMCKILFHPFIAGIILCAVFAATISTIDSQILVLVSVLSEDVYHRFFHKTASNKESVWVSRLCVVVVALISYLIAVSTGKGVLALTYYSWSGLGSTFGPVLILTLYSKKINGVGAITGMIFGGVVSAVWPEIVPHLPLNIPALIPGFVLNLGVISCVSQIWPKKS